MYNRGVLRSAVNKFPNRPLSHTALLLSIMFVEESDVESEFYNKPIHDPTDPSKARLEVRLIRLHNQNPFEPDNLFQHIKQILLCIKAEFQDYVDMQTQQLLNKPKGKGELQGVCQCRAVRLSGLFYDIILWYLR